jgi:hypothetical protein
MVKVPPGRLLALWVMALAASSLASRMTSSASGQRASRVPSAARRRRAWSGVAG